MIFSRVLYYTLISHSFSFEYSIEMCFDVKTMLLLGAHIRNVKWKFNLNGFCEVSYVQWRKRFFLKIPISQTNKPTYCIVYILGNHSLGFIKKIRIKQKKSEDSLFLIEDRNNWMTLVVSPFVNAVLSLYYIISNVFVGKSIEEAAGAVPYR